MAGRRILRSGKEFSAYDLAIGAAVSPPQYFSVADCLKQRLEAQQFTQILDEPVNIIPTPRPPSPPTSSPSLSPPACPPSPPPFWVARDFPAKQAPATKLNSKKLGSKRRKRERRELDASQAQDPGLKAIHRERRAAAKKNALQTDFDAIDLPHSTPSWIGKRSSEDGTQAPNVGTLPTSSARAIGMGSRVYTQEELNRMSGTDGFTYIDWLGELTIPIIDSHRRLIALLGGKPKDLLGWKKVTDSAAHLLESLLPRAHFTVGDSLHRRAHPKSPYPSVSRGLSHGGGQTAPGELCNHPDNIEITDEMLEHECFQRIVGFANCLFRIFAPILFAFYQAQMALLAAWNSALKWPFVGSVFAACTFNFGPQAVTCSHLDFGNLAWGWCSITSLGWFDADRGGHLILWDLKLIIRFPPGATILIPSAIIRHSNIPVQPHEKRFSFVQYTAGGLFRWIRNGYMTDEDFLKKSTMESREARDAEAETRWEEGVKMFSIIDDL
ncbi:hypothetical protein B0H14DRAFT_2528889 [Mycena olivaceomarginata]|nr:hypothetical protein B0H14DRAFT_2551806 [Mycena olivaceomarginata]KAJ7726472.1 hypothetical protein B0H14DRAFT_2544284 [Mycena olivaceomarginata]KAJ7790237.1 hypothetical protein B0H14DRAFT_3891310 [Mycena olivaceomarginata]KAJ7801609.1 hypothetical protein B0H14DRAFT_2528889 [Mycena olivaceomarginata]